MDFILGVFMSLAPLASLRSSAPLLSPRLCVTLGVLCALGDLGVNLFALSASLFPLRFCVTFLGVLSVLGDLGVNLFALSASLFPLRLSV